MAYTSQKKAARLKRKKRIRKKISGSSECPRLCVYRSNRYFYIQAIDDINGNIMALASSREKDFEDKKEAGNKKGASKVGKMIAQRLQDKGISEAIFDRNGYRYHGCVKAIADAAREQGIKL